jgi:Ni/Fe-hydrogenase b-type cytochrome subunit
MAVRLEMEIAEPLAEPHAHGERSARCERDEHPYVVRMCHWTGALAVTLLMLSGLEIFAAFPSFGDKVRQTDLFVPPAALRLGGWLGGALQWHLTFAWLLVISGVSYLIYQVTSGNIRQVLFVPRDLPGVWPMARHYFLLGPKPPQTQTYNPLQKLAYTTAIALGVILCVTGAALYKPVQLSWLVAALGGFRAARVWHFAAMCGLAAFIPGHLLMVALHGWRNFASMFTGTK